MPMSKTAALRRLREMAKRKPSMSMYSGSKDLTTWPKYKAAAAATADIDYDCRFDEKGVCKVYRAYTTVSKPQCCCQACAYCMGYLNAIEPGSTQLYIKLFDQELGFWRPGVGCTLPRERRSPTCLRYHCMSMNRESAPDRAEESARYEQAEDRLQQLFQIQPAPPRKEAVQ